MDTLEKLKVIIEASTAPLKKAMNEAKQIVKSSTDAINSECDRMKDALDGGDASGLKQSLYEARIAMKSLIADAQVGSGLGKYTNDAEILRAAITETDAQVKSLQNSLRLMEMTGEGAGTQPYDEMAAELERAAGEADILRQKLADLLDSGNAVEGTGILNTIKTLGKGLSDLTKKCTSLVAGGISKAGGAIQSLIHKFQQMGAVAKSAFSGITSRISSLLSFGRASGAAGTGMKGLIGSILKANLVTQALGKIFHTAMGMAKEGIENLVQADPGGALNQNISMLMSSLTQLKNALASAFAPIINAVAPYLNMLINLCTRAANAVGMLLTALTGGGVFNSAKKVAQNYAGSLGGVADSAGAAQKATKELKRELMGFDEVNKLSDQSDQSPVGGGGAGAGGINPADMFEKVSIPDSIKDIAQKIKDAWKNADFTEIGGIVGGKLRDALDSIPWEKIQETLRKIARSVATFLNGFLETPGLFEAIGRTLANALNTEFVGIEEFVRTFHWGSLGTAIGTGLNSAMQTIDWQLIQQTAAETASGIVSALNNFIQTTDWGLVGHTFAEGINTAIAYFYTAVSEFDWPTAGANLATAVNTAVQDINWEDLGKTINEAIQGLLEFMNETVEGIDWKEFGNKVGVALQEIDWDTVFSLFFEAIGAVLGGLAAFVWGIIEPGWDEVVQWWKDNAYEDGEFTMKGLLDGILKKLSDIGAWIKKNIFDPFIKGFKEAFGISSPSKEMEEQGGYIMDGLLEGAKDKFDDVISWFKDLPGKIEEAIGDLTELGRSIIQNFADGFSSIDIPTPHIDWDWTDFQVGDLVFSIPSFDLSWYAGGGFPGVGEMFMAREDGPEMVGRMGSRSAVANNDQIVSGISDGVYRAVVAANEGKGSGGTEVHIHLDGDAKKFFRVMRDEGHKYMQSTGKEVFE